MWSARLDRRGRASITYTSWISFNSSRNPLAGCTTGVDADADAGVAITGFAVADSAAAGLNIRLISWISFLSFAKTWIARLAIIASLWLESLSALDKVSSSIVGVGVNTGLGLGDMLLLSSGTGLVVVETGFSFLLTMFGRKLLN